MHRMQPTQLEQRIREIGEEIFARAHAAEPSVIRADWWMHRLLDWSTAQPRRKLQLFRFIDVLPSLRTDEEVVRHLAAYLLPDEVPLPRPFRRMLRGAAEGAWYGSQLAALARTSALRMARQFIAGQTPDEAIETIHQLREQRMGFTLDILGEATTSDRQADWYAAQCMELLRAMTPTVRAWPVVDQIDLAAGVPMPRLNLSVKLSSLDPNFDPIDPAAGSARVLERLRPILREARRCGAFVNVDMEQFEYKDLTLATFQQVMKEPEFRDFADAGIVLQAYLRDTPGDFEALMEWVKRRGTPIAVRLVKGAYWDFEAFTAVQHGWPSPVWTRKWESDANFEQLSQRMLDHRHLIRPAIASHNVRSLAAAMAYAESIGASKREFELQMLFGMGDPLKTAVVGMDYALRVYTPFGELIPGMAYLIRRLLENTSNESFLRHSFSEREPLEELLADPAEARPHSAPVPAPLRIDPEETDMTPFQSEPATDFSREEARQAMQQALAGVRERFGQKYPLVIDGDPVTTPDMIESENPSDFKQMVGRVSTAGIEHVERAVAAARAAQPGWSTLSAHERGERLLAAAEILRQRRFELAAWIIYEVGKPWREADADVAEAIDFLEFYSREMERLEERPRRRNFPGEENVYVYQPRGVAAIIAPWNFPLAILTGMTAAALAAGNTVVMKPAEQSSVVAAKLMEAFLEAGLPPGVVNYLPGSGETVGAALVAHPGVNLIAFTGSREVGVAIYEQAAKWQPGQEGLKRVIAEMGGKNAIIVDADADLDEAVGGVIHSVFGYAGQKCSACSRVIVHQAVGEAFVERLIAAARSMPIGPADSPSTLVGPVIDAASRDKILRFIEQGRAEGKLVFSADVSELARRGYFVPPTIFDGVPPQASIAQEEIFGPVVAVLTASDFDEALQIANGTPYALTGGLYSRNPEHLARARREFNVGNLYINRGITGALVDRQPFGGFKMSGIGSKAGGPDYLLQFLEPKTITENTLRHGFAPESASSG